MSNPLTTLGERAYRIFGLHYKGIHWDDLSRVEKFAWEQIAKSIRAEPVRERKVQNAE